MTELSAIQKRTLDRVCRWNLTLRKTAFNVAIVLAMGLVGVLVLAGGKESSEAWTFGVLLFGFMGTLGIMGNQALILAEIVQKRGAATE